MGLESLKLRRKLQCLCTYYKIKTTGPPDHLFRLILSTRHSHQTRTLVNATTYQCRVEAFKSSFFPWTITEWNSLDLNICSSSYTTFKKYFIHEFRPVPNYVFNIHNPIGIKLLTGLRFRSSHLYDNRYNHKFKNCGNPKCICRSDNVSTSHLFWHCHFYIPIANTLFDQLKEIFTNLQELSERNITDISLTI